MSIDDILRYTFGCKEDTIRDIEKWVEVMPDRDKVILEKRLQGKSMRDIGRDMGISHPTVSGIIHSWTDLRHSLEDATEEL